MTDFTKGKLEKQMEVGCHPTKRGLNKNNSSGRLRTRDSVQGCSEVELFKVEGKLRSSVKYAIAHRCN